LPDLSAWGVVLYLILEVGWGALLYEPRVEALLWVAGQGGVVQRAPTLPVLAPQVPLPTLGNTLHIYCLKGLRYEMIILVMAYYNKTALVSVHVLIVFTIFCFLIVLACFFEITY
jgi:hypothetical protein